MDPFNLFGLPVVAREVVVRLFTPLSRVQLYKCSRKTKYTIKRLEHRSQAFKLCINFEENWVELEGVGKFYVRQVRHNQIVNRTETFQDQDTPIEEIAEQIFYTFWDNDANRNGLRTISKHYINFLELRFIKQVNIGRYEEPAAIATWFLSLGLIVEHFDVQPAENSADALGEMIYSDTFLEKVTMSFQSWIEDSVYYVSPQFQPTQFSGDKTFNLQYFIITEANWFIRRHLMALNCETLSIMYCQLTNGDIKDYMAVWRKRKSDDKRTISIFLSRDCEVFSLNTILEGIVDPGNIKRTDSGELSVTIRRDDEQIKITLGSNNRYFFAALE